MSKEVTMRDIAKKLNISAVSVSKAISGREGVGDELRETILKTARDMGYCYTAHDSERQQHANIGVMVSQAFISDSAFYSKMFQSLAIEFGKAGHSCTLEIINHKDEEEGSLPGNIAGERMDGVIVLGPMSAAIMKKILHMETPCVFVDNYTPENNMDCVVSDNVFGSHMLTNYLINKGHRKIAFVGNVTATNSIMDRYLGYLKGLLQNGYAVRPEYVLSDRDGREGYIKEINLPKDMPDAFVCNCDEVAYHLIEQLRKLSIKVPEDVSVVGFDDYIFATISNPQLTTFKVNMDEMSKTAVDLMNNKLKNPHITQGRKVVSGEIVIRDSVKDA